MGIPYYFYAITQKYRGILQSATPEIDYYFFDFNGVIHPVCRHVMKAWQERNGAGAGAGAAARDAFENDVCRASWEFSSMLIERMHPKIGTGIFIDGVAPVAKINQQRKRRYLSVMRQKMEGVRMMWDTNAISPGTDFMARMTTYLREHAADRLCVLSTADETGEGEHKIFEYIKEHDIGRSRIAIHGLDADLIMLSLLSHLPHIYLVRENKSSTVEEPSLSYLGITALRSGILREFTEYGCGSVISDALSKGDVFCKEACDYIESYVVACFLLGNDFLPHPATLSLKKQGIDKVMRSLCDAQQFYGATLVQDDTVNLTILNKILEALAATEDVDMMKVNEEYLKQRAYLDKPEDAIEYYPIIPKNKARLAQLLYNMPSGGRWRSTYYKELFCAPKERLDSGLILQACKNFMVGVVWTYRYYKRLPKDAMWYYPYNYGPTLLDLSNYLLTEQAWLETLQKEWEARAGAGEVGGVSSAVQLLSIMPIESAPILPRAVARVMETEGMGCTHMFPVAYPIQTYLKTHLWECVPVLPPIDFARIARALA